MADIDHAIISEDLEQLAGKIDQLSAAMMLGVEPDPYAVAYVIRSWMSRIIAHLGAGQPDSQRRVDAAGRYLGECLACPDDCQRCDERIGCPCREHRMERSGD